jgi:DNA-binding transcriptional LysR family regulator
MELHQLQYFVAVADEGNFTRAAAKLLVSQPGVSAQIRRLERELGEDLLDRSGRSVRLTEAGAAVLPYARTVDLPGLLAEFSRSYPQVEITLSEGNTDDLLDGLRAGRLDAAIVSTGMTAPDGIELEVIADQPIVAAVSHDHELAARNAISLTALRGRPLISLPRGTGLRARLDEACAAAGFTPKIAFEASAPEMLAELAAHGLGAAILPGPFAQRRSDQLTSLAIRPPGLRGRLVFAWRAGGPASPAGRALTALARRTLSGRILS